MHLAYPSRKASNPPAYLAPRSSRFPMLRRSRVRTILLCACVIGVVFFILSHILGGDGIPAGTPPVVIVTVLDSVGYSKEYHDSVKENRIQYARKHGYATFFPRIGDYDTQGSPNSWTKIPAARHALSKFPHSEYIWVLEQNVLIMNPTLKVEDHILKPKRLESLMIKEQPIVPPDSVIKTFPNLRGESINLVLTQYKDGLSPTSFIVRKGEWTKFFLDTWFDPLYRSYNFQKADRHALEHIVQWHPTILSKLALVPSKIMNADNSDEAEGYKDGDFVVRLPGCDQSGGECEKEAEKYTRQWKTVFAQR